VDLADEVGFGVGTLVVECGVETTKRSFRCWSLAHFCHEEGFDIVEWLTVHEWNRELLCRVEDCNMENWRLEDILEF
jgi:hypothetical protein